MTKSKLTYELAYAELTKILQRIQQDDVGLEELTSALRRARDLISFCREQLYLTEQELTSAFLEEE